MKRCSVVALILVVGLVLSSCGFTTTCPTYAKKERKDLRSIPVTRI